MLISFDVWRMKNNCRKRLRHEGKSRLAKLLYLADPIKYAGIGYLNFKMNKFFKLTNAQKILAKLNQNIHDPQGTC